MARRTAFAEPGVGTARDAMRPRPGIVSRVKKGSPRTPGNATAGMPMLTTAATRSGGVSRAGLAHPDRERRILERQPVALAVEPVEGEEATLRVGEVLSGGHHANSARATNSASISRASVSSSTTCWASPQRPNVSVPHAENPAIRSACQSATSASA
jgi:hypothetical protein